MNRLSLVFGVVLSLWGVFVILYPKFYDWRFRRYFDFTGYNVPLGIFVIIVGVLFILTSIGRKYRKGRDHSSF